MENEKFIDFPNALDQYFNFMGDESAEFITQIITSVLEEAPRIFAELDESYKSKDYSTFRRAAHTLKSSCSTVGATTLAEKFLALEIAGAEENIDSTEEIILESKKGFEQLSNELIQKTKDLSLKNG